MTRSEFEAIMEQQPDLAALYRRFHKPLRKWLERRCHFNGVDPDDVAQDVFARLLAYPHTQQHAERAKYIFRIAANVATEYDERVINRNPHLSIDSLMRDDEKGPRLALEIDDADVLLINDAHTPEAIAINESIGAFVRATVASMPERMRAVFLMRIYGELPYQEVARRLGITCSQVVHDLEDARELLREKLA